MLSRSVLRPALVALVVMSAVLVVGPAGALALKYHSYEIVPNGSPEVPVSFTAELGSTVFNGGSLSIRCEKGVAEGSFTSRKQGAMTERFRGCTLNGSNEAKVETPGAAAGELVTVNTPIEVVAKAFPVGGPEIVINPKSTAPNREFIPVVDWGSAKAGPIIASIYNVPSSEGPATKFSESLSKSGFYEDALHEVIPGAFSWTNFKHEEVGLAPEGTGTYTFGKSVELKKVEETY